MSYNAYCVWSSGKQTRNQFVGEEYTLTNSGVIVNQHRKICLYEYKEIIVLMVIVFSPIYVTTLDIGV